MSTRNPQAAWDSAVATYLTNRRALGRIYEKEEYTLNHVRRFLVVERAADLDEQRFDRWRAPFYRLSNRTRTIRERTVYNFCRAHRSLTTDERQRLKDLERENRELKRTNEILRLASAFFAQAELGRRPR